VNARVLFPWLWLLVGVAFVMLVWPTRVRLDRLTGEADMLLPDDGWVPMAPSEDGDARDTAPARL
jgi:hypothetical protein